MGTLPRLLPYSLPPKGKETFWGKKKEEEKEDDMVQLYLH